MNQDQKEFYKQIKKFQEENEEEVLFGLTKKLKTIINN